MKARAGRPPARLDLPATTRIPATLMAEVEAWANAMTRPASPRSAAIGIGADSTDKADTVKRARAKELAAHVIGNLADGAATADGEPQTPAAEGP
jgi:hypothetical protein